MWSLFSNSNSYFPIIPATTNFEITSANVFPVQTLFPPKNGVNAKGCLFFPSGYKEYSL